ncbi:3-deoxy-manno-octulosonate cytidylyltransferase [Algicola sagamiensis]|uniref:3-deoxy-manno-octulosonate cytidylyltransferase n=1 Tax=Algicola sagamiensis TaxID=163869 RepID=UPI000364A02C|nr:3-deoxy-manno-octulosonate cytidylyltransferase [Algicola sagamiensis]
MAFVVVIPARYASSRLPGKPLADICGKPMIQHVYEQAVQSKASQVVIATDDARIEKACESFGAEVCMTSPDHQSGTERLAEVIEKLALSDEMIVVNVQGDEPLIPPRVISQVAENLASCEAKMATLSVSLDEADIFNPNAVKVVRDKAGMALYFSRAAIPFDRAHFRFNEVSWQQATGVDMSLYQRHIGIYAYRAGFIRDYIEMTPSPLEKIESLEQLRVLWHGEKIHVAEAIQTPPAGVDTPEDLEMVKQILQGQHL